MTKTSGATNSNRLTATDIAYIALFTAVIAICSWISIPMTVPFTLQTFAVFAAVGLLGGKRGTLTVTVYVFLGAVGVPVFAGMSGGIGALIGSTGGYIIGFIFSAIIAGFVIDHFGKSIPVMAVGMVLGLIACYAFGTAWFMVVYGRTTGAIGVMTALGWCVFPFIVPDLVKIALAILISKRVGSYVKL